MMLLVHSVYTTAFCDLLSFSCRSVRKLDFWVSFQTRQIMTLWDCEMGRAAIPELFDKFVEWDNWCDRMFQNIFTLISLCRAVSVSHFFFFFFFFLAAWHLSWQITLLHTHFFPFAAVAQILCWLQVSTPLFSVQSPPLPSCVVPITVSHWPSSCSHQLRGF